MKYGCLILLASVHISSISLSAQIVEKDIAHNYQNMRLFSARRVTGGYEMTVHACANPQATHFISDRDFEAMNNGTYTNADHGLDTFSCGDLLSSPLGRQALVLHLDPSSLDDPTQLKAADDFTFALQKNYPGARIYRDPLSPETDARVGKLNHFVVKGPNDIIAVVAPDSFGVDQTAVHNIEDELKARGVTVVEFAGNSIHRCQTPGGKGLIVVTGHSSQELSAFVDAVGEAGYFEGNYVLFISCETELTREMIQRINVKYSAVATFAQQGTVEATRINLFLHELSARLFTPPASASRSFGDLVAASLRKFRLNGIWTLCRNENLWEVHVKQKVGSCV